MFLNQCVLQVSPFVSLCCFLCMWFCLGRNNLAKYYTLFSWTLPSSCSLVSITTTPSHLCPAKCLLPAPLTLSVGAELCRRWWRPGEAPLIFRHLQTEGWTLVSPDSWEPVGTVHCRSWFMALPILSSAPAPLSACWVLDLHYGLVEFLTILRWKPGARAPLVYKT